MPLMFPIADNARAALAADAGARSLAEASRLAGHAVALVSEWLRPVGKEADELVALAEAGASLGFVQRYEDAKGAPVLAVTYWKAEKGGADDVADDPAEAAETGREAAASTPDTVDDLYFERPGAQRRRVRQRRPQGVDPRQLDLFAGPGRSSVDDAVVDAPIEADPDLQPTPPPASKPVGRSRRRRAPPGAD